MVCAVQGQIQPSHGNERHGIDGGGNRRSQRQQQRQRSGKPPLDDSMSEFYESKQKKQALLDNIEPAAKRVLVSMIHDALFLMAIESHHFQRPTQSLQVYVWEFWNISWIKIDDEDLPLIVPKNHGGSTAPFTAEEVAQLTQHHELGHVLQKIKNRQDSLQKVSSDSPFYINSRVPLKKGGFPLWKAALDTLVSEHLPSSFSSVYSLRTSLPRGKTPDGRVNHAASSGAAAADPTNDDEQKQPAPSPKKKLSKGEKMRKKFQQEMDEKVQQAVAEALKAQSSESASTNPSPGTVNAAHGQGQQSPASSTADSSHQDGLRDLAEKVENLTSLIIRGE